MIFNYRKLNILVLASFVLFTLNSEAQARFLSQNETVSFFEDKEFSEVFANRVDCPPKFFVSIRDTETQGESIAKVQKFSCTDELVSDLFSVLLSAQMPIKILSQSAFSDIKIQEDASVRIVGTDGSLSLNMTILQNGSVKIHQWLTWGDTYLEQGDISLEEATLFSRHFTSRIPHFSWPSKLGILGNLSIQSSLS